MKATFFAESATAKKRGILSFFKKDKARTIRLVEYWGVFYAFGEDAKLLKRKFRFEKSFEFDNFSICIPQEKFSEVISYLALNGFRVAVKTRVPD